MVDEYLNVQLAGKLLKVRYLELTVMCGDKHTVSLFFNDVTKITTVNAYGVIQVSE